MPPGLSRQFKNWKDPAAVAAGTWTNYDVPNANAMLDKIGLKKRFGRHPPRPGRQADEV